MTTKKNPLTKSDISIDAAMAANLAIIPNHGIVRRIAKRQKRDEVANPEVRGGTGKRSHHNAGSQFHIVADVRQRMNQIDEPSASLLYRSVVRDLILWVSDGADKNIALLDFVVIHIPEDP